MKKGGNKKAIVTLKKDVNYKIDTNINASVLKNKIKIYCVSSNILERKKKESDKLKIEGLERRLSQ